MQLSRNNKIKEITKELNLPEYRNNQVFEWIYKKNIKDYTNISNLPKDLIQRLEEEVPLLTLNKISEVKSKQTTKLLFETIDGNQIETVLMTYLPNNKREMEHNALCISSQCGCNLGCRFCSTGAIGFKKNLDCDEIVDQYLYFEQKGIRIDTIFFSGMGEPFANPNLFEALEIFTNDKYIGMGERRISISTVGLIPGIEQITEKYPQINLAYSLHSPFPNQRLELMPITKAYPIDKVMNTLNKHILKTNRKVFIAYILLSGTNDTPEHSKELVRLIKSQGDKWYLYHINLIKYHSGPSIEKFYTPDEESINIFKKILDQNHIQNTLRGDFGLDIDAACGQLYAKYSKSK